MDDLTGKRELLEQFAADYDDLTELYHRAGLEALETVLEIFGGTKPHIPKPQSFWRGRQRLLRDEQIRRLYSGGNAAELASAYGLAERDVRRIVDDEPPPARKTHDPCGSLRVRQGLHDELVAVSRRHGISVRQLVEDMLHYALQDSLVRDLLRSRYGEQAEIEGAAPVRTTDWPAPRRLSGHG